MKDLELMDEYEEVYIDEREDGVIIQKCLTEMTGGRTVSVNYRKNHRHRITAVRSIFSFLSPTPMIQPGPKPCSKQRSHTHGISQSANRYFWHCTLCPHLVLFTHNPSCFLRRMIVSVTNFGSCFVSKLVG